VDPAPCQKWGTSPAIFAHVRCGQMAGLIKIPVGTEVGLGKGDAVLDGEPAPRPKNSGHSKPHFWPMYCGQAAVWIKMPFGTEVNLGPSNFVLGGEPQSGTARPRQFSTRVSCGQTAGWTKMPLGTEVGLCQGHIVLDGDAAPPRKAHSIPTFRPMSIVAKRLDGSRCHLVQR